MALQRRVEETLAEKQPETVVAVADPPPAAAYRHQRMRSGRVVWCDLCGAYAETKAVKLAQVCPGQVEDNHTGGQCLRALRRGRHPKTGAFLGTPIPEHLWRSGTGGGGGGEVTAGAARRPKVEAAGSTAHERMLALRARVRAREGAAPGGARSAASLAVAPAPAPVARKLKRDGGDGARGSSAGGSHASARWDALRRRVRAREENGASWTTATESGGKAESGRGGRGGQGGQGRPNDNLTKANGGAGTSPTSAPVTPVGVDLGEDGEDQGEEGTVAIELGTCGRAPPAAARNGRQDAAGGAASMEVEEPGGDAGDDTMQLD